MYRLNKSGKSFFRIFHYKDELEMFQKNRKAASYLFLLFTPFMLFITVFATDVTGQTISTETAFTNDSVLILHQFGSDDDEIVSRIKDSDNVFLDISNDALRSLKRLGVSDRVIEFMKEVSTAKTKASAENTGLPSSEGCYISDDPVSVKLHVKEVETRVGLSHDNKNFAVDGFGSRHNLYVPTRTPTIIIYQKDVNIEDIRVSLMSFSKELTAVQFDMEHTDRQSFKDVYGKSPDDVIRVNLHCPVRDVEVRIEAVDGKAGMYRLIPVKPLEDGYYAIYAVGTLHGCNNVFRVPEGRKSFAYNFWVDGTGSTNQLSGQIGDPAKLVGSWIPEKPIDNGRFPEKDIRFFSNGELTADNGIAGVYTAKNRKLILNLGQIGTYIYDYELQGTKLILAGYGGQYTYKKK